MSMARRRLPLIQFSLATIVVLAIVTSGLSIAVLVRALSLTETHRRSRVMDAVSAELSRLAAGPTAPGKQATTFVAVRGGWLQRSPISLNALEQIAQLPPDWRAALTEALAESAKSHSRVFREIFSGGST